MWRTLIVAGFAIALLGAGALALISRTTESGTATARQAASPDSAPSVASGPSDADPVAATPPGFSSGTAVAPTSSSSPAAPVVAGPRKMRSARGALLAAKLRQIPKAQQSPAALAEAAQEGLPPEERAAMEATGMDWSKLEQMMRDGAPVEGGAADADVTPDPREARDAESM
jgi:hypothetical protein